MLCLQELLFVTEEEIFAGFLASAILGVAETSREGGLLGTGQHDGATVAVLLEGVEEGGGEAKITLHEFGLVLGAVDTGKVEHEVAVAAVVVELLGCGVDVGFVDGIDG